MVITTLIFSIFFSVNDSTITFKKHFIVKNKTDTSITLLYPYTIEDYEAGNYFFPAFTIDEIKVEKRRGKAFIQLKFKNKREAIIDRSQITLTRPQPHFFIKTKGANQEELKRIFMAAGYKFDWLDSLKEADYTILGVYTENKLRRFLLKTWKKKH